MTQINSFTQLFTENVDNCKITHKEAILYAVIGELLQLSKSELMIGMVKHLAYQVAIKNDVISDIIPIEKSVKSLEDSILDISNDFTNISDEMFKRLKQEVKQ